MATPTEEQYAVTPPAPQPAPTKRVTSGKTLFIVTLAVVIIGLALAVIAGVAGLPWLGFVVPAAYFVYLVVLLYFAGRAISFRNRPGEAATSILLALLLVPVIAVTPAVGIAGNLLADGGVQQLLTGGLGGVGDVDTYGSNAPMDDSGGDETELEPEPTSAPAPTDIEGFSGPLPEGARDDVSQAEYAEFVECMNDPERYYAECMAIVS